MKVEWSQPAREDQVQIRAYIAADARQFVERIIGSVRKLREFPLIGHTVPEAERADARELIYQNYRIVYLVESERVFVLGVIHGSRDTTRSANQPWEIG